MKNAKKVVLPETECELGYTDNQIKQIMGDRTKEFYRWMGGQTVAVCDGRLYNHAKKEYENSGCGPHGAATYPWDVTRFLAGLPVID